jgi:AAA+ ATPase superfamily predicted ATPase
LIRSQPLSKYFVALNEAINLKKNIYIYTSYNFVERIVIDFVLGVILNFSAMHNQKHTWQGRKLDAEFRFVGSSYKTDFTFDRGTNTRPVNTQKTLVKREYSLCFRQWKKQAEAHTTRVDLTSLFRVHLRRSNK